MNKAKDSKDVEELKKGARNGSPTHQYEYAKVLLSKSSGANSSSHIEAIKYLELAAKSNVVEAQVALADEQSKNPETYESAISWFKKAVSEKNNYAIKRLGELLYYNSKNDKEIIEGLRYLRTAASLGNSDAAYQLGIIYLSPKTEKISPDEDEAVHYLKVATKSGNVEAMKTLGLIYGSGSESGVIEKNLLLSKEYFEMAIKNNSIQSYHDLAVLYFKEAFKVLNEGEKSETKNNSIEKNEKVINSTSLKNILKNLGVEF